MNILIVRLGALGDIVHAIPAAAALRAAFPAARLDWLVDAKHREILELVPVIDRVLALEQPTIGGWIGATRQLRAGRYDVALDFQGLMKSAVLARASGARRVLGFSIWHLREKGARPFYSDSVDGSTGSPRGGSTGSPRGGSTGSPRGGSTSSPQGGSTGSPRAGSTGSAPGHVVYKNLRLLEALDIRNSAIEFPLSHVDSPARDAILAEAAGAPFAVLNPGAAWPNKCWFSDRFGELASFLKDVRGLEPFVLWGPGEEGQARAVVEASGGAARLAPPTGLADLVEVCRVASLMVSGDTGPLHIAAAVGTPIVSIFGPTDPVRNGPWSPEDISVSRFDTCGCHYDRRCRQSVWCLSTVPVTEVMAAVQRRLGRNVER